jgi:hypothetical protein
MPLSFPSLPNHNQTYSFEGRTWTYSSAVPGWNYNREQVDEVGKFVLTNNELADASFTDVQIDTESVTGVTVTTTPLDSNWATVDSVSLGVGVWIVNAHWEIFMVGAGGVGCRIITRSEGQHAEGTISKGLAANNESKTPVSMATVFTVENSTKWIDAQAKEYSGATVSTACRMSAIQIG